MVRLDMGCSSIVYVPMCVVLCQNIQDFVKPSCKEVLILRACQSVAQWVRKSKDQFIQSCAWTTEVEDRVGMLHCCILTLVLKCD